MSTHYDIYVINSPGYDAAVAVKNALLIDLFVLFSNCRKWFWCQPNICNWRYSIMYKRFFYLFVILYIIWYCEEKEKFKNPLDHKNLQRYTGRFPLSFHSFEIWEVQKKVLCLFLGDRWRYAWVKVKRWAGRCQFIYRRLCFISFSAFPFITFINIYLYINNIKSMHIYDAHNIIYIRTHISIYIHIYYSKIQQIIKISYVS